MWNLTHNREIKVSKIFPINHTSENEISHQSNNDVIIGTRYTDTARQYCADTYGRIIHTYTKNTLLWDMDNNNSRHC